MPKIRVNDLSMYFELRGLADAPPIVFIGGLGNDHSIWSAQVEEFSSHYLTLTFDNRDVGQTDESPRPSYAIADMAQDTVELMQAVGIEKAHIVGYSMGGAIAQEIALHWAEKVATLTLVATFSKLEQWGVQIFQKFGPLDNTVVEQELFKLISPLAYNWRTFKETNLLGLLAGRPLYQPSPGFARQLGAVVDHNTFTRLNQIKVPTLVIAGEKDVAAPAKNLLKIAEVIEGAKFHLINGASHQLLRQAAAEFNQTLEFFLLDNLI